MQKKQLKDLSEIETFDPVFPLKFNASQNIYILTQNSFANKLVELSIGNKTEHLQKQKSVWYLHPQQALYLISVSSYSQEQQKLYRKSFILNIYKNSHPQDIEMLHFYLNLRKRNKFYQRIDKFLCRNEKLMKQEQDISKNMKTQEDIYQLIQNYKIFKVYQTHEDYKNDKNFNFYMMAQTEQSISSILFDRNFRKIKQALNISTFNLCIIKNNDFIITHVNQF